MTHQQSACYVLKRMEEIEYEFTCPHCLEPITMVLDLSVDGTQSYVEDCEVCCNPIQISYTADQGELTGFDGRSAT